MARPRTTEASDPQVGLLEALQGAHETLGFVIDRVSEGVLIVDRARTVVYANPALSVLARTAPGLVSGRPLESLFFAGDRDRLRHLAGRWASEAGETEVRLDGATGEGAVVKLTGAPLRTESFLGALVIVSDVSDRWLRERQEEILAVAEHGLVEAATLADGCVHLLRTLGVLFGRPAGRVLLLGRGPDEPGAMHCWRSESGRSGPVAERRPVSGHPRGLLGGVVASGLPARSTLAEEGDPAAGELAAGLASAEAFPVFDKGRVAGAIELFGPGPPAPHDLLTAVMGSLGDSLGAHVAWRMAVDELGRVFDASPVGICQLSPSGRVTRRNPAFTAMLEQGPAQAGGLELWDLVHEEERASLRELWAEVRDRRRDGFDVEVRGSHPPVRGAWLRLAVAPDRASDGEGHLVLAAQDVTERRMAELDLLWAHAAEAAANERLRRMHEVMARALAVVSHEFRTGLFGVQGYSEILCQHGHPAATVRKYAANINQDAKRMTRLINDLLDLNRMEAGHERLRCEEVDLARLIQESVQRARAGTDRHVFTIDLAANLPGIVADPDRLTQVMGNILGNAVKYSPEGGEVTVRAGVVRDGLLVEVGDQGIGIPANLLESVFEPFTRSEDRGARTIKGTGLGLPIVRNIVNLHGGRVWAESGPGPGSTFRFILPLRPPDPGG